MSSYKIINTGDEPITIVSGSNKTVCLPAGEYIAVNRKTFDRIALLEEALKIAMETLDDSCEFATEALTKIAKVFSDN